MKKMKKIVGLLLTMVMVLSMTMTAFADEKTYSITINNSVAGHTYEAYQIFTGDLSNDAENDADAGTGAVLSNVKWGSSVIKYDETAVTEGSDATAVAKTLTETTLDDFISKLTLGEEVASVNVQTENTYVIDRLKPGYYLIKDLDGSLTGKDDSYTEFIVEVLENSTVNPKSDIPSVEKKVDDVNDSNTTETATNWQDSADYDIGDAVPFKLTGTLPSNYSEYAKYKMVFHDTLPTGLDKPVIKSVYLAYANGNKVADFADADYDYEETTAGFDITFANLKTCTLKTQINNSMKIVVEYTSVLNENAKVGAEGNPNKVKLEFSNDPNYDGSGEPETGKTPDDTVIVFTYETIVDKVDKDGNALEGAEFKLEKKVGESWVTVEKVLTNTGTTFSFKGLDDGEYRLTETKTPAGYNSIDPIYFTVTATHSVLQETAENKTITLESLTVESENANFAADVKAGIVKKLNKNEKELASGQIYTEIVNQAGATLPETGGMGTTLFYVLGTILVVGAAVMLITKKRMSGAK